MKNKRGIRSIKGINGKKGIRGINQSNSNQSNKNKKKKKKSKSTLLIPLTPDTLNTLNRPETNKEKIKNFLYLNPEQSSKEIVEKTKVSYENFKNIINRDSKEKLFEIRVVRKEGQKRFYSLSSEVKGQIDFLIKQKKEKEEKELERQLNKKAELQTEEDLIFEVKNLLNKKVISREDNFLFIDLEELQKESPQIFMCLEINPDKILNILKIALKDKNLNLELRFKNFSIIQNKSIDELNKNDIDKLICIEAKSTSLTDKKIQTVNIKFECPSCGTVISVIQEGKKLREPSRCSCGRRGFFRTIEKTKEDFAYLTIEDLLEKTESISPKNIKAKIKEGLTSQLEIKKFNPGNDLVCLGILREAPIISKMGKVSNVSNKFLEVLEAESFEKEINIDNFDEEEIKKFEELSKQYDKEGFSIIRKSIAPQIYGYNEIKDSMIIQASQPKNNIKSKKEIRNKSNILLIGDPGTSKTILMKYFESITQNSKWTVGSGSSAVGLRATVERDDEGSWILKPGALVLAKELTAIDEFNNLRDEDKPILQEAMNDMQITIDKASFHTRLQVTCGIMASANPVYGTFQEDGDIIKQFNLLPQIMNRFDFIFIVKDRVDEERDLAIAKKMMSREAEQIKIKYDKTFFRKYFIFIRNQEDPKFQEDLSKEFIPNLYAKIRKTNSNTKTLLNPRFVETIIRGSKASARLRLSKIIEKKDVERVFEILKKTHFEISFTDFSPIKKEVIEK